MPLQQDVIDRLLIAKDLLNKIRFVPTARPDRITLARHILTAHDTADLAIAGIARHLNKLPQGQHFYLMDYFPKIRECHPKEEVPGRDYFAQLNTVRNNIKHHGIFPDMQQWHRVAERTYEYISVWCEKYLSISIDDLDESALISNADVKILVNKAKEKLNQGDYKGVLEEVAFAMQTLFDSNKALRNLVVGHARAEDAIKLSAFGVHSNDFLALQEFLPSLIYRPGGAGRLFIKWSQGKFGHPANWTQSTAEFSLRTFVNVTLRIQDAEWIPGAIDFSFVYEHRITAKVDGVEIVQERRRGGLLGSSERVVVRTLRQGESIRGDVTEKRDSWLAMLEGREPEHVLSIHNFDGGIWGEVEADKVDVTCVPRNRPFVQEHFPDLSELDYNP